MTTIEGVSSARPSASRAAVCNTVNARAQVPLRVQSERPPDRQAEVELLAGLSDEELAGVVDRSAAAFAAAENGPDTPDAYPLHAPPRTSPSDR
jgi:hypothetical protein